MKNKKILTLVVVFIQILTISLVAMFTNVPTVSASCFVQIASKSLRYTNINGSTVYIKNDSSGTTTDNLVLDDTTSTVRASMSLYIQNCSDGITETNLWMNYWDVWNNDWAGYKETGAQTTNTYTFNIITGDSQNKITKWSAGFQGAYCSSTCTLTSPEWINFYMMHQDSNTITSEGILSAKFTIPWLSTVANNNSTNPTYSVLVGTDPAVRFNRNSFDIPVGSTEIQIPAAYVTWSDSHIADKIDHGSRMTMNISNYLIPNLTSGTTYYWRIKQVGSNSIGYMPGSASGFTTSVIADQRQPSKPTFVALYSNPIAQTFTQSHSGRLAKVVLSFNTINNPIDNLLIGIFNTNSDGSPGNTLLSDEVVVPVSGLTSPDINFLPVQDVIFINPPLLTAGQKYAIRIRRERPGTGNTSYFYVGADSNNPYPNGAFYQLLTGSWTDISPYDLFFSTYMTNVTGGGNTTKQANFGIIQNLPATYTITAKVFVDDGRNNCPDGTTKTGGVAGDGLQNGCEQLYSGASATTVQLEDSSQSPIGTPVTIVNGQTVISNLTANTYKLALTPPAGYVISTTNANPATATVGPDANVSWGIQQKLPDLRVDTLSITPASLTSNQAITFSGRVFNTGNNIADQSYTRLRIDSDSSTDAYQLTSRPISNNNGTLLGAGLSTLTVTWPNAWTPPACASTSGCTHSFEVCANTPNNISSRIPESDYTNNCSSQTFTVYPPLTVTCSPNASTVASGATVTWTAIPAGGSGTYSSYAWTGDAPINTASHTNSTTGVYANATSSNITKTANVTVTDSLNHSSPSASCTVTITPALYSITTNIFVDDNGDGVRNGTESLYTGIDGNPTITLTPNSPSTLVPTPILFTGLGHTFPSLPTGTYTIFLSSVPVNYKITTTTQNIDPSNPANPSVNFGILKNITPWIQTTGGDVHSNTNINTPGGPK